MEVAAHNVANPLKAGKVETVQRSQPQLPQATVEMSVQYAGCTIVATGKLENFTRDGINAKIFSLGATPGSSVTKKTDYLICGEKAGSKLAKAQQLGDARPVSCWQSCRSGECPLPQQSVQRLCCGSH